MKIKKYTIADILVLLLIVTPVLFILFPGKMSFNVSELIEDENINDINLTIYYLPPSALMFYPVSSVEDLIHRSEEKIVINGSDLEQYIDLFRKISNEDLVPVWKKTLDLDLRVYYVLESKKNGKLLEVSMWGDEGSIFVNGTEVKGKNIFCDVIIPFLPEDISEDLDGCYNA